MIYIAKKIDTKLWAFLVMFLGPLGVGITYLTKNHTDKYVVHYMKQLFTLSVSLATVGVLTIIPLLGVLIGLAIAVVGIVLWFMGWIYALSGEKKLLPVIGEYADDLFKGF